jgi:ABC-2 type transport system ATP-binding protein
MFGADSAGLASSAILARGLTKTFPARHGQPPVEAVRGLDLTVPVAMVYGLLGPNGAGKTTVFRMLTTLLPPDAGEALVAGCDLRTQAKQCRTRIGLVSQAGGADRTATGRENLVMAARLYGLGRTEAAHRAEQLEETFALGSLAKRLVKTYSGGQRRRLELALGMINQPEILFLDEPTAGLDPQSRAALWEQIRRLRQGGTTVVLTTHYLEEADALADRLCVIDAGQVIAEGVPAELKQAHHAATLDEVFLELTGRSLRDGGAAGELQAIGAEQS